MPDSKPYNVEWIHFKEVAWGPSGEATRYQCRYCPWAQGANATRLRDHYMKKHFGDVEGEPSAEGSSRNLFYGRI